MVGQSKILTVSYGTFTCTLEGFDDPFSTMRGIAEYFRDLTADDRYFGAEPPIPDAEMLHRIAQNDAAKRVVARVEDRNVTLSQVEEKPAVPAAPTMVAAQEAPISDPFVDEPADIVALNEPSQVETESVAAKLARIRAVVSNDTVATDQDDDQDDEIVTSSPISSAFDDAEQTLGDIDAIVDADEIVADEPEPAVEADTVVAFDTETTNDFLNDDPLEHIQPEAHDGHVQSVTIDEPTDETEVIQETSVVDEAPAVAAETSDEAIADFMGALSQNEADDEPEANVESSDSSVISRIMKMRRSDFDAAKERQPSPEIEATSDRGTSLSAEDEAELMANLERVQRRADAEERSEKEGRALLENQDIEASAESVSRILDVTNTELNETEGTRRRSAIAHLKAAVAATRADKFLSKKRVKEEQEDLSQYRDDLAKVVKPRRPADSGKSARQAPLMLVSEQRVIETKQQFASDGSAVSPRRVSSGALDDDDLDVSDPADTENMFVESSTFLKFAKEMGASELPDLLEAAAAYSAYVEGQEYFSRPQIMQAVAAIREEEFSREEGLRSFGLLLRRGKIKKLRRGQFAISDTTRFQPQPRAVGE
ncbi:MAG: hypothetical protein V3U96_03130 [Paracoccaceae bacterium]